MSWRDHRGLGKITPGTETLAGILAKIPAKIFSCQDPVRIPAGKFRFPARFFISRQDPGRKRDSWRDPAGIPVAILQGINLVHTVNNNFVPIRALNAHDSEAVQPILPHRASKARTPMLFNKFDLFQMPPCLFVKECYIIILMLRGTLGMRLYQIWNKAHFKQSSLKLPFMIDGNSLVLVWDSLFFMG